MCQYHQGCRSALLCPFQLLVKIFELGNAGRLTRKLALRNYILSDIKEKGASYLRVTQFVVLNHWYPRASSCKAIAVVGRSASKPDGSRLVLNVTMWAQLIIWDEDQMIWDG